MFRLFFKSHGRLFIGALASSLAKSALVLFMVASFGTFVMSPGREVTPMLVAGGVTLILAYGALSVVSSSLLSQAGGAALATLRLSLIHRVLGLDYAGHQALDRGKLYAALTTDINLYAQFIHLLPLLLYNAALTLLVVGWLVHLSVPLTALLFLLLGVVVAGFAVLVGRGHQAARRANAVRERLFQSYGVLADGFKELVVNHNRKTHFLRASAQPAIEALRRSEHRANVYWGLGDSLVLTTLFGFMLLIYVAGKWALHLEDSHLAAYAMGVLFLATPVEFLLRTLPAYSQARIAFANIMALRPDLEHTATLRRQPPPAPFKRLTLDAVSWHYDDGDAGHAFRFGPVSADFAPGSIHFVTGGNGSGKSTLLKILLGLIEPRQGRLVMDGRVVAADSLQWYRQHFHCIFQDFFLFDTVLDGHGRPVTGPGPGQRLADWDLQGRVQIEQARLSTTALSQGQRRRLALLLADFEDTQVYVFDEWAADQDPVFRDHFYREVLPALKRRGKLVIAVTHDDKYFDCCDRILHFEHGRIVRTTEHPTQHTTEHTPQPARPGHAGDTPGTGLRATEPQRMEQDT